MLLLALSIGGLQCSAVQTQREELQGRCERLESRVQALQQRCSDAEASTVSLELQVGLLQQRLRASTAQVAEQVISPLCLLIFQAGVS